MPEPHIVPIRLDSLHTMHKALSASYGAPVCIQSEEDYMRTNQPKHGFVARTPHGAVQGFVRAFPASNTLLHIELWTCDPSVLPALLTHFDQSMQTHATQPPQRARCTIPLSNTLWLQTAQTLGYTEDVQTYQTYTRPIAEPKPAQHSTRWAKDSPREISAIRELFQTFGTMTHTHVRNLIADQRIAVACDLSIPRAALLLNRNTTHAEIVQLATHPSAHRRGFARALLNGTLHLLGQHNPPKRCTLKVRTDNLPAISLYITCGFQPHDAQRWATKTYHPSTDTSELSQDATS